MSEYKRMGKYSLKQIGAGGEAEVYQPKQAEQPKARDKRIVIKNFEAFADFSNPETRKWISGPDGFDDHYKELLQTRYTELKREYGQVIPLTRFIKNPDHPKLNLLVQELIECSNPASIFEYFPVDIEDEDLKVSIAEFVDKVKKNIRLYRQDQPATIPDLEKPNLVLSADGKRLVYLDSGVYGSVHITLDRVLQLAQLSMLGGMSIDRLRQDPFFSATFKRFPDLDTITDEHEFYNALLEHTVEFEDDEDHAEIT